MSLTCDIFLFSHLLYNVSSVVLFSNLITFLEYILVFKIRDKLVNNVAPTKYAKYECFDLIFKILLQKCFRVFIRVNKWNPNFRKSMDDTAKGGLYYFRELFTVISSAPKDFKG